MFYIDLDRKQYQVSLQKYIHNNRDTSKLHAQCKQLLQDRYPTCQILEEIPIKIKPGKTLYLDFFLPLHKLAIEVHGQQHYSKNSMFHRYKFAFAQQLINDNHKKEWCTLNEIRLIELEYNTQDIWREKIGE